MGPTTDQGLNGLYRTIRKQLGPLAEHCVGQLVVAMKPIIAQHPTFCYTLVFDSGTGQLILDDRGAQFLNTALIGTDKLECFISAAKADSIRALASGEPAEQTRDGYIGVRLELSCHTPGTIIGRFSQIHREGELQGATEYQLTEITRLRIPGVDRRKELPISQETLAQMSREDIGTRALSFALENACSVDSFASLANTMHRLQLDSCAVVERGAELFSNTVSSADACKRLLLFAEALRYGGNQKNAGLPLEKALFLAEQHAKILRSTGAPPMDLSELTGLEKPLLLALLSEHGHLDEAKALSSDLFQFEHLRPLVMAYAKAGEVSEARALANEIIAYDEKAAVYGCIAATLAAQSLEHQTALNEALSFARKATERTVKRESLIQIARELQRQNCGLSTTNILQEVAELSGEPGAGIPNIGPIPIDAPPQTEVSSYLKKQLKEIQRLAEDHLWDAVESKMRELNQRDWKEGIIAMMCGLMIAAEG